MKLKYTGQSHNRDFVKADFARHGIDDQGAVHFNVDNNFVAEVSDTAGTWLIANEAPEFREATEEDETVQDLSRVGTQPRAMGKLPDAVADDVDASSSGPESDEAGSGGRARGRASTTRS